jgi:hypothetical protein
MIIRSYALNAGRASAASPLWTQRPVGICALSDGKLIVSASIYIYIYISVFRIMTFLWDNRQFSSLKPPKINVLWGTSARWKGRLSSVRNFSQKRKSIRNIKQLRRKKIALNHSCGEKEGDRLSILIKPINWPYSRHTSGSKVLALCAPRFLAEK